MRSGGTRVLFEHVEHDRDLGILFRDVQGPALQFPWHFHPELELTFVIKGAGRRYVGDSIERFDAGDLCLIGAGTPHCWLTEQGDCGPVHALVIQFLAESLGRGLLQTATFRPLHALLERARRGLLVSGATHAKVAAQMRLLFAERTRSLDRYVGLLGILTELSESADLRELALLAVAPPHDDQAARLVANLLSFIHERASDAELSFNQVARAAGMSRASLGRAFPRLFGRTFARYLAEVRVVKACALLSETGKSVAEIASETGFGSVSNFNRRFLSLKRVSPLRYRKTASVRGG